MIAGALRALLVTIAIEVPLVALLFPKQRARMALVALVANAATNLALNLALHGSHRILVGETAALVLEAAAYVAFSRPHEPARALVASGLGNLASYALGPALACALVSLH